APPHAFPTRRSSDLEKATEPQQVPLAEPVEDNGDKLPGWLDRFTPWVTATVIIVLITYGPSIVRMAGEYTVFPGHADDAGSIGEDRKSTRLNSSHVK